MDWSAAQYTRFEDERNRPIRDLLARVLTVDVKRAADIGCGPGNSTELLRARFPMAAVTGMDSSPDMLAAARKRLPDVRFDLGDIATWSDPGPYDAILANAALQWVPDHSTLLPALLHKLAPGGSLAVQMPDNLEEPSHRLMRETASAGPWADTLKGAASARTERHDADWYFRTLREAGATTVDVWRTTYFHPLTGGAGAVVEWFKGSGLRPFLEPLDAGEKTDFLGRYQEGIAQAYPAIPDGTVLLPFPRLFIVATR
ncbi:trans-aconitate methyltransferase [Corallococcus coralloides]|uniref:Trans-aconitate methyltransferase n=1 Tax=Corallococcus coralloides TaxID=184914 RepID=A0A410RZ06_CORCK|nr:trans-aconitate 2-methyltransferase [Corallococcus coralloides]QAT87195.1 trans-aconitate methyltransferase [Corallococcus coralloides]